MSIRIKGLLFTSVLSCFLLCSIFAAEADSAWRYQTVDSIATTDGYNAVARDSSNHIHISYYDRTDYSLKYATNSSGSWVTETVDPAGGYTSISVDLSNDSVHISYIAGGEIKYATKASGTWTYVTIADAYERYNDIALDSNGSVHISYNNGTLRHATNAGGSWITEAADSTGNQAWYNSIAVDSSNNVHISHWDLTRRDLEYSTNKSGTWATQTLDSSSADTGHKTSIAIDSSDNVHISYQDWSNMALKYATNRTGSWIKETIDSSGSQGWYPQIATDSSDKVHIVYTDNTNDTLKYVTDTSGTWTFEILDSSNWNAEKSIVIDAQDNVHISTYEPASDTIKYITNAAKDPSVTDVDDDGFASDTDCNDNNPDVSPAMREIPSNGIDDDCDPTTYDDDEDADGYPAHLDCDDNDPSVNPGVPEISLNCIDDDCSAATPDYTVDALWTTECIANDSEWQDADVAVDSSGHLHVIYSVVTGSDFGGPLLGLMYAHNRTGTWEMEMVDSTVGAAAHYSIVADSEGNAHIGYRGSNEGDLLYATNASGTWIIESVDPYANNREISIALDSSGNIHISYAGGSDDMRYATNASGSWNITTLDTEGLTGWWSSIAITSTDKVHISFTDYTTFVLKHASNVSGSWIVETLDNSGIIRNDTSIALDSSDNVFISYYDDSTDDLRYASNVSGLWSIETIEDAGSVGRYNSLEIDSADTAQVSYYDATNYRLQYSENSSGSWSDHTLGAASNVAVSSALDPFDNIHIVYGKVAGNIYILHTYPSIDGDSDGYTAFYDCDDSDPDINPGETETWYDGIDTNCDGWNDYDQDMDGYVDSSWDAYAGGSSPGSGDCDDSNALLNPGTYWYPDSDEDGFGNPSVSLQQCVHPAGYVLDNTDCDDSNPKVQTALQPARVLGTTVNYFSDFQEAYDAAEDGDMIQCRETTFTGNVSIDLNKYVTLQGGYDCGYSTITGVTTINGNMTISNGTVAYEHIKID